MENRKSSVCELFSFKLSPKENSQKLTNYLDLLLKIVTHNATQEGDFEVTLSHKSKSFIGHKHLERLKLGSLSNEEIQSVYFINFPDIQKSISVPSKYDINETRDHDNIFEDILVMSLIEEESTCLKASLLIKDTWKVSGKTLIIQNHHVSIGLLFSGTVPNQIVIEIIPNNANIDNNLATEISKDFALNLLQSLHSDLQISRIQLRDNIHRNELSWIRKRALKYIQLLK